MTTADQPPPCAGGTSVPFSRAEGLESLGQFRSVEIQASCCRALPHYLVIFLKGSVGGIEFFRQNCDSFLLLFSEFRRAICSSVERRSHRKWRCLKVIEFVS